MMPSGTTNTDDILTCYQSKTYKKEIGCGHLYITVAYRKEEEKEDKIDFIRIIGDKDNACGASYNETISDLLTFSIRRIRNEHEARAIVKALRYHRCNNLRPNKDHVTSCSDAVGQVLEDTLNLKKEA